MMECLQSIDPVRWIFPCSAFVLREKRKENLNLNMNSFWRWWESMSTPQLMALGWQMNASVRDAAKLDTGKTFTVGSLRETKVTNFQCHRQKHEFYWLPLSRRVASWSAHFPDIISVSSSINHITTLLQCKSRLCLPSNGGKRVSCIHNFASSIIQQEREREGFHGCRRQLFAISLYRPLLGTIAVAACNQRYLIVTYAIADDDATTCDDRSRKSKKCIRRSPSDRFTQSIIVFCNRCDGK